MRDKVQRIQMMLEERRQRRSARRENQRPYPRPSNLSGCTSFSHQSALIAGNKLLSGSIPSPSTPAASTTTTGAANHAENVETTNYRKPNMEQETVAVWETWNLHDKKSFGSFCLFSAASYPKRGVLLCGVRTALCLVASSSGRSIWPQCCISLASLSCLIWSRQLKRRGAFSVGCLA